MKVIITAGGTGGHIYPALGVYEKIMSEKGNECLYIGTTNRMESEIVPKMNIPYEGVEIYGLGKNIFKNIKNIGCIIKSYKKCLKIMDEFKPDIVLGFGGYVSFPVLYAAKKRKIKTAFHEQNYIPGKTNKLLSKFVNKIFISFDDSKKYFSKKDVVYTGNPSEERARNIEKINKTSLGFDLNKKLIIIVMGSLGSSVINEKLCDFLRNFNDSNKEILFITGKSSYKDLSNNLVVGDNIKIVPYLENLPGLMKSADLIISRAGAGSISEIKATKVPAILIPSPYVANNHQYYNALDMQNKNLSLILEEKDLSKENLNKLIDKIFDENFNKNIKENLNNCESSNALEIISKELKDLIKRG